MKLKHIPLKLAGGFAVWSLVMNLKHEQCSAVSNQLITCFIYN